MKDLPVVAKAVINILLYIVYVLLASVVFSFLFPLVMQIFGQDVIDPSSPENRAMFDKIQYFIAILVLLVSLVLRKYFYICDESSETVYIAEDSYSAKKKATSKKKVVEVESDDDIKIYVEKEIK